MGENLGKKLFIAALLNVLVLLVGKVAVDQCLPDYGHRIVQQVIVVPPQVCEPLAAWDGMSRGSFSARPPKSIHITSNGNIFGRGSLLDFLGVVDIPVLLSANFKDEFVYFRLLLVVASGSFALLIVTETLATMLMMIGGLLSPLFRRPLPVDDRATRDLLDNFRSTSTGQDKN